MFCLYDLVVFWKFQRHCCILSKAGFCTRLHVHTHLPTRIYTVHNVVCDYKTMRMIPITTHKMSLIILSSHLLCVHAPCHWMLIKEIQKWFEKLAWSSKNCAMKWKKKTHSLGPTIYLCAPGQVIQPLRLCFGSYKMEEILHKLWDWSKN